MPFCVVSHGTVIVRFVVARVRRYPCVYTYSFEKGSGYWSYGPDSAYYLFRYVSRSLSGCDGLVQRSDSGAQSYVATMYRRFPDFRPDVRRTVRGCDSRSEMRLLVVVLHGVRRTSSVVTDGASW